MAPLFRGQRADTTTTDVPSPDEHLGFRVLAEDEITPELRDLRAAEATHGLDPTIRVCMRLDLNADAADKPDPKMRAPENRACGRAIGWAGVEPLPWMSCGLGRDACRGG